MITRFLIIGLVLLTSSCQDKHQHHPILKYYPSESVFEDGYVNKSYRHYLPNNPDAMARTEIRYTKYQKTGEFTYKTDLYNAGFQWTGDRYFQVIGDTIKLERGTGVSRGLADTLELNIVSNVLAVWQPTNDSPYRIEYEFNDKKYHYSEYQRSFYDSTIAEKPAKVFINEWEYRELASDSIISSGSSRSFYVHGLGFFGSEELTEEYSTKNELIEQMSTSEFERRSRHSKKRIAYIDPESTLSDDSDFNLCSVEERIADYYNARPYAQYKEGKKQMERIIFDQLDREKLVGENGLLTFRFVVNCEGKAGRFVAEQFDFNYQRMDFSQNAVDHLLGILLQPDQWQALVINEEARDAYVYITFKIEHGEIIDILP